MDTHTIDIAAPPALQPRLLTIDDFCRMYEVGIRPPDARLELIEGQIFDMSPIGPRHQLIVDHLNEVFSASIDHATTMVRVHGPVRASDHALAQPAWPSCHAAGPATWRNTRRRERPVC